MILYTNQHDKIQCTKTKRPKLNNRNVLWDYISGKIDGKSVDFHFTLKNNRAYFFFQFNGEWYKTQIVNQNGLDLWHYIYENSGKLYLS